MFTNSSKGLLYIEALAEPYARDSILGKRVKEREVERDRDRSRKRERERERVKETEKERE